MVDEIILDTIKVNITIAGDGKYFAMLYPVEEVADEKKDIVRVFKIEDNNIKQLMSDLKNNNYFIEHNSND